jgi:hypothetical protein
MKEVFDTVNACEKAEATVGDVPDGSSHEGSLLFLAFRETFAPSGCLGGASPAPRNGARIATHGGVDDQGGSLAAQERRRARGDDSGRPSSSHRKGYL